MEPKTTLVSLLLDETGSMASIWDDTIGGYNSYIDGLKAGGLPIEFSLVKFDSNKIDKVHVGLPIADVPHLTRKTYVPGASTPLIDAAVKIIRATEAAVAGRDVSVVVVIQTDGQENCSAEFTYSDLAALVKEKTALGWQFVFLGAGLDAFDIASQMGIPAVNTMSYNRAQSGATFDSLAANTRSYAASADPASLAFTPKQRSGSGDEYADQYLGGSSIDEQTIPPTPPGQPKPTPTPAPAPKPPKKRPGIVDDFTL